jgi:hypothetical protein
VLVVPAVVVMDVGLLEIEKSGVKFGETTEFICLESWDGVEDFAEE